MKRALAWFAGLVGIAALGRWLARRRHPAADVSGDRRGAAPTTRPRSSVASSRARGARAGDRDRAAAPEETLEERRARVHAKAREAIDAMADDGAAA